MYVLVSGREVYGNKLYGIVNLKNLKRLEVNESRLRELLISFSFLNIKLFKNDIVGINCNVSDYFLYSGKIVYTYIKSYNEDITLLDSLGEKYKISESELLDMIKNQTLLCLNLRYSSVGLIYPDTVKEKSLLNTFEVKSFYVMKLCNMEELDDFYDIDITPDLEDLEEIIVIDKLYSKKLRHEFSIGYLHEHFKSLNISSISEDCLGYSVEGFKEYKELDINKNAQLVSYLVNNKDKINRYSDYLFTLLL